MAIAERHLAARFNNDATEIINHRTWAICSDGDMIQGVSAESASLAGRLGAGLRKLTVFYDGNDVTLDGFASVEMNEDIARRFNAYGWHVSEVADVNDLEVLDAVVAESIRQDRPSLVIVRTHIGYGSSVQDTSKAHGSPLGGTAVSLARQKLGWNYRPFEVPDDIYAHWRRQSQLLAGARADWDKTLGRFARHNPERATELERISASRLPDNWRAAMPCFDPPDKMAARPSGAKALNFDGLSFSAEAIANKIAVRVTERKSA